MDGLTTNQAIAVTAVASSILTTVLIFGTVFYVLLVIALWKIFTKAGEKGWKALIPIYNVYITYKISELSFLTWCIVPAIIAGVFGAIAENVSSDGVKVLFSLCQAVIMIVINWKLAKALAGAFGKSTGFALGLFFFPNIFQLILGFGTAKYVLKK